MSIQILLIIIIKMQEVYKLEENLRHLRWIKDLQQQLEIEKIQEMNNKVSRALCASNPSSSTQSLTHSYSISRQINNRSAFRERSNTNPHNKYNYLQYASQEMRQATGSPTKSKYKYLGQKENIQQQQPIAQQMSPVPIKEEPKQPQPPKIVEPSPSKGKEEKDYAKLKEKFDKLQRQHKKSLQEIISLKQQIAELEQEKEDLIPRSSKFFEGDVLVGFQDYKERLTQLIEQRFNAPIKRTKLLFRLEKDHPRNLHPFVDNHSPFVVIVKNKKEDREYHFACVSEGALSPNLREQKRGWLISLTNGRTYAVASGKPAVLYDEMYLIFGNQQLRIDGSSSKAFSNFGISNSFYNTSGNDVRDFLGPGLPGTPREAEVDSYEIFQVIF